MVVAFISDLNLADDSGSPTIMELHMQQCYKPAARSLHITAIPRLCGGRVPG